MKKYDYIFAGAGLSALMTVYQMILSGKFKEKKILLLDADSKKNNDRTWCFWEKPDGDYEHLIYRKWNTSIFSDANFTRDLNLSLYQYKMIQGMDFYQHVFEAISKEHNIEFLQQKIIRFTEENNGILVETEHGKYF
ncbi:MAG: lycopene cyclase, partial [Flavobacterium johnsoniae]